MKSTLLTALAAIAMAVSGTVASSASTLVARVNVGEQTMTVLHRGEVIHTWKVSTARQGYITPRGEWRPVRMHRMWHSRTYDNAPMPFAVFYDRGWAVHGTSAVSRLGSPASHGCIRLATPNAEIFYTLVRQVGPGNTKVVVVD